MKNNQIPKKDKIKLMENFLEDQQNQQKEEKEYVAHPLMILHETSPETFRSCTMSKGFFHNMFQLAMILRQRNQQNELTGIVDPVSLGGVQILDTFLNTTTLELIREGTITRKWTAEEWAAEEENIKSIIQKAYEAMQSKEEVEQVEQVKEIEAQPKSKILMSESDL